MQLIKIKALPQVQKLHLRELDFFENDMNEVIDFTCSSYEMMVVAGDRELQSISFNLTMTIEEMEIALNEIQIIQDVGKMSVLRQKDPSGNYAIIFILLASFDVTQSEFIPILKLESNQISVNCSTYDYSQNYSVSGTLILTQNMTFADGFNIGLFSLSSAPRLTPVLPVNISQHQLEQELNGLLEWLCNYPSFYPIGSIRVLFNNSYEESTEETDDSTAFCGRRSSKSPTAVWDDSNGLINHNHVREKPCVAVHCLILVLFSGVLCI